jgi:hypothetical protein
MNKNTIRLSFIIVVFFLIETCLFSVFATAFGQTPQEISYFSIPLPSDAGEKKSLQTANDSVVNPSQELSGVQVQKDSEINNLVWNRRATKNFVILSLNDDQGRYLQNNLENMKKWTTSRWGLSADDFLRVSEGEPSCMVLCVPDKILMKKLFNLDGSYGETILDENGTIKKRILWLLLDGSPADTVPPQLTMVCLRQLEQDDGYSFGYWMKKGMSILNGSISQIESNLFNLNSGLEAGSIVEGLMSMSEEDYKNLTLEKRKMFDGFSTSLCLLLRKEFGEKNFLNLAKSSSDDLEREMREIYGFQNLNHLNDTFKRYSKNLLNDIKNDNTPDSYLQITPAKYK